MDAARFWHRPGVVAGLRGRGFDVVAPDRWHCPPNWATETEHLLPALTDAPTTVVAGSNGCSVAVRLALAKPGRVTRLLLAWPATAGDPVVDARIRANMTGIGAEPETIVALLAGETLRGVTDA